MARKLGISLAYVSVLASKGRLKAPRKEGGRVWYDAAAVEAFAETWTRTISPRGQRKEKIPPPQRGPIAAEAFALLADGVDWRGLVVRLKIDPVLARDLVREYETTPERAEQERRQAKEEKEERARQRNHERNRRLDKMHAHQMRLVQEAQRRGVSPITMVLPAEPGKPKPMTRP